MFASSRDRNKFNQLSKMFVKESRVRVERNVLNNYKFFITI